MKNSSTFFAIVIIFTMAINCRGRFLLLRLNDVEKIEIENIRTSGSDLEFQNERGTHTVDKEIFELSFYYQNTQLHFN